jgi:hypothetical protein
MDDRVKIYEDKHSLTKGYVNTNDIMTEKQKKRGEYYSQKYFLRRGELDSQKEEWDELQKLYECGRERDSQDPTYPNNFMSLITPTVEGQVAAMMENDIEYNYLSDNPSHQKYLPKLESASAYCREINHANLHYKDFARIYDLLGNAWITVMWEKSYSTAKNRPDGYPRIMIPPILSVLVDGRIKDYKDLQHAEYIIHEILGQDLAWARKEYGDDAADGIARGFTRQDGDDAEMSTDDADTFTLLHVWTRDNEQGNLQLIEMDTSGFILRESDPSEPYYKTVDNEYPFYFGRMMPKLGNFYGFGDGKILQYMQKFINNLVDELEIAVRFNAQPKTFVDVVKAKMSPDDYDSDPSHCIPCVNPQQNVYTMPGMGINNIVLQTIQLLLDQAQKATRFSDIMSGVQQGVSATATQINGQLSQGSVGIKDKASDIQAAMSWCDRFCLRLCLQFWDTPFWVSKFRNAGDEGGSEFLDMTKMAKVPGVIPVSGNKMLEWMKKKKENPDMKIVDYETAKKGKNTVYVDLDFNVHVKLAAGFPKGKNDVFNQLISLVQIAVINPETGTLEPIIPISIVKEKLEQILGFKITLDKSTATPEPILANAGGINPLSASGEVAQPQGSQVRTQPSNLAGTVPLANDNRGMQL